MKIAVDAMGSDYAPHEIVLGAIDAVREYGYEVVLVGDQVQIEKELNAWGDWKKLPITVQHASEVITMHESPSVAVRKKKDASLVVATRLVRQKECDAVISAGSTGAGVAAALFGLGRIKGIERPTIATPIPNMAGGTTVLVDSGATVDAKPIHLVHNAIMGSLYAEHVLGIETPRVGLLNIGEEDTKGNEQAKLTYPMLKKLSCIRFIGNAEGRDIPKGDVDVVVCDGFVGNVVLKFGEGLVSSLKSMIKEHIKHSSIWVKMAAAVMLPTLKKLGKKMDHNEYGGAPLLGINGCFIICHGSSKAKAIKNAIRVAAEYKKSCVVEHIKNHIAQEDNNTNE